MRATFRPIAAAAALAVIAPLAACSQGEERGGAAPAGNPSQQTLAAAIADAPSLSTISDALSEAGLAGVFDGPGSYTILAPNDQAFEALGSTGEAITEPGRRAELVGILRGHILPGHLTPDAIRDAIAQKKGPVTMRTLADGTVTFASADGKAITVSSGDGTRATIQGDAIVASNGVVLPIDGLVKTPPEAPAATAQ